MALSHEEIRRLASTLRKQSPEDRELFVKILRTEDVLPGLRELPEEELKEFLDLLPAALAEELRKALAGVEIPPELIDEILRGNCVLFLGAGVSFEAGMPSSQQLVRALGYDPNNVPLTIAAQQFETKQGRTELCTIIKREFEIADKRKKSGSYQFIANIPKLNSLIITTNYDRLLEEALKREKKTPLTICREAELPSTTGQPHVIVKLHGDIDQSETVVITQGDYARLAARLREPGGFGGFLATILSTRIVIFVGFSMADEDFRLIRDFITTRMIDFVGRRTLKPPYAIMPWGEAEAKVLESQLNIKVIRGEAKDFFAAIFRRTSEFLNREDELREVCEVRKEPFVEIVGPAGSGKTMLLSGIETFYRIQRGFNLIVSIALEEKETPQMLSRRLADQYKLSLDKLEDDLRGTLVLFTFDGTERAPEAVRWLERELLPRLRRIWTTDLHTDLELGSGRVIFAGRQHFLWQSVTRFHLYSLILTPFPHGAVEDMAGKYYFLFRREMPSALEKKRIAQAILSLTGTGHAGFIKTVLYKITDDKKLPKEQYPSAADLVRYIEEHTDEFLEWKLVPQLNNEILKGAEEPILRSLEDVICVFRRLNNSILTSLPQRGLDQYGVDETWFTKPDALLRALDSLHILSKPDARSPMYRLDPVVGFLLSAWLRRKNSGELYRKDHEVALDICDEGVQRTPNHFQLAYALEGLYHLQCLREIGASQVELADKARQYLGQLRGAENGKALAMQWKDVVMEDPDLRWKVEEEARRLDRTPEEREEWLAKVY